MRPERRSRLRAVRSVEEQRLSPDRVPLFELPPDLESQERTWLSAQPGAYLKLPASRPVRKLDGYGDQRKQKN